MYIEGEVIEGIGVIEGNHCGLPWLVSDRGLYNGVLQLRLYRGYRAESCDKCGYSEWVSSLYIDAISGKELSKEELIVRLNNPAFDYEDKASKSQEWRLKNRGQIKEVGKLLPVTKYF